MPTIRKKAAPEAATLPLSLPEPPKRGPGRPPKLTPRVIPPFPKRGPGRPSKPKAEAPASAVPKRGPGRPALPEGQKLTYTERSHRRRAKLAEQLAESRGKTTAALEILASAAKGNAKANEAINAVREQYAWVFRVAARAHGLATTLGLTGEDSGDREEAGEED